MVLNSKGSKPYPCDQGVMVLGHIRDPQERTAGVNRPYRPNSNRIKRVRCRFNRGISTEKQQQSVHRQADIVPTGTYSSMNWFDWSAYTTLHTIGLKDNRLRYVGHDGPIPHIHAVSSRLRKEKLWGNSNRIQKRTTTNYKMYRLWGEHNGKLRFYWNPDLAKNLSTWIGFRCVCSIKQGAPMRSKSVNILTSTATSTPRTHNDRQEWMSTTQQDTWWVKRPSRLTMVSLEVSKQGVAERAVGWIGLGPVCDRKQPQPNTKSLINLT